MLQEFYVWRISREGKEVLAVVSLCPWDFTFYPTLSPGSLPTQPSIRLLPGHTVSQVQAHHRGSGHSESRAQGMDLMEVVYSESDPKKQKCGVGRGSQENRKSQD